MLGSENSGESIKVSWHSEVLEAYRLFGKIKSHKHKGFLVW